MRTASTGWQAIIPLKSAGEAKSRLDLPRPVRRDLVRAFAHDVITACEQCGLISDILVVADDSWREHLPPSTTLVPDPGDGLNPAIAAAAAVVPRVAPRLVLMGDLPSVTPAELTTLLSAAPVDTLAAVADARDSGTTVLMSTSGVAWPTAPHGATQFGVGSFAAHCRQGAVDASRDAGWGLRVDVDMTDDLDRAVRLGVGARTASVLARADGIGD